MYSRFWHKFLYDLNLVPTEEPFKKLVNQGMIQGIVENVIMLKERKDGKPHFISADLITSGKIPPELYSRIPVHIDFVSNYGQPASHLNEEGIRSFIHWRPEYADAFFETTTGIYTIDQLTDIQLVTHSEIGKMSKRYHNVVNPDDVIERYGADCFRMYEMFLGPYRAIKAVGIRWVLKVSANS